MKIVHINKFFCPIGGAEKIMLQEARILEENGHEVYFFATDRKPYFIEDYKHSHHFAKYTPYTKLSPIQALRNIPKLVYDRDAEKKLENFLNEVKPDIVHLHEFFYNLTPSIINACKKKGIPVVMTLHTARLVCPTGKGMLGGRNLCEDMPCARGNSIHCLVNNCFEGNFKQSAVYALEFAARKAHRALEKIDHFISPSQALADAAMKAGFVNGKISIVPNFLDKTSLSKEPNYSNNGYFLYVGRLAHDKGVHYLIEAFSKLPKEIELHLVGTGPQQEEFMGLTKQYGLNNIKFQGFKSGEDLEEEYKNCIASLLPCYWFEIFGLVIIEANSWGKPVIASNLGAIPEVIDNGVTGLLTNPADPEDIARAVKNLYNDKEKVWQMGKNARKKAEEKYNPELHYEKIMEIYRNCLK